MSNAAAPLQVHKFISVLQKKLRFQLDAPEAKAIFRKYGHGALPSLPAPSGANKKSFPRGAPMQHLAPRRNPEG